MKIPMTRLAAASAVALILGMSPALADDVTDAMTQASTQYQNGDLAKASHTLLAAHEMVQRQRRVELGKYLPPAPAGATRVVAETETHYPTLMRLGDVSVIGDYHDQKGNDYTIGLSLDNSAISGMKDTLTDPKKMKMVGSTVDVNGHTMLVTKGRILALADDGRMLVMATGADPKVLVPVLKTLDLDALKKFEPKS